LRREGEDEGTKLPWRKVEFMILRLAIAGSVVHEPRSHLDSRARAAKRLESRVATIPLPYWRAGQNPYKPAPRFRILKKNV